MTEGLRTVSNQRHLRVPLVFAGSPECKKGVVYKKYIGRRTIAARQLSR